jgi:hypothetical protein
MNNIIGFDFSINKPAACVFSNNKYFFYAWPYQLSEKYLEIYKTAGVNIINRIDTKDKGETLSSKMRYEVENSDYLANLITETLLPYLNMDTYLAFEGLSYASSGDVVLQLGGYKYMLMSRLSKYVPLKNMFTYSPITVKSIAGCAKRGMGKSEMINEFIKNGSVCKFRLSLFEKREIFMKKGGKTWIDNVDDFVDSFWVLETLRKKEGI